MGPPLGGGWGGGPPLGGVGGCALGPHPVGGSCFGRGGWARAGRGQRLELRGSWGWGGLPAGRQLLLLLLLLLDDELLLLHRLRWLLQELGLLQRGVGCGGGKGG